MAKQNYRIEIPTDVKDYAELITDIDAENDKQGDKSPVHHKTEEIKEGVSDMEKAVILDEEAKALDREAEKKREQRDILWKKRTRANERGWRKIFEGAFIKAIHKMGDYGYEVNTSPKPKKPPGG